MICWITKKPTPEAIRLEKEALYADIQAGRLTLGQARVGCAKSWGWFNWIQEIVDMPDRLIDSKTIIEII